MAFHSLSFDKMNESDVREEFLSPLLDMLGYRVGAEGNVLREHALSLRYPRLYLGRKDRKTDPYLRGRADYILEVKGHARWVLEAKGPNEDIDANSIEQACSYASHPEVRAPLFVLSNGRRFLIFRTSAPPNASPLLETTFESIQADLGPVEQILSVEAIRREYRDLDTGEPIARGLGSLAKISNGFVRYTQSNLGIRAITELQAAIVGGTIERGANGGLVASIQVRAPISSVQDMIQDLGLDQLQYESDSRVLSDNPGEPTHFEYREKAVFPEGREIFDVTTGTVVRLPTPVSCHIVSRVDVFLANGRVVGGICNTADYFTPNSFRLKFRGRIEAVVL